MRIGLLAPLALSVPPAGYGGTERVVAALARALAHRGHQVVLFARAGAGAEAFPNVRVVDAVEGTEEAHVQRALELAAVWRLDVVHDHTKVAGVRAAAKAGVPVLTTIHNDVSPERARTYGDRPDHAFVALSQAHARRWPGLRRLAVVPNGLEPERWPMPAGKQDYWLFLGRIDAAKGADIAARMARDLDLPLVMAGPIAPAQRAFFEQAVEPYLDGVNRFHVGEVDGKEKWALLASARGLLCPLQWEEPFGLVVIEALAAGTPVVATRRGAMPELIAPGVGRLVDNGADLAAWRTALDEAAGLSRVACQAHVAARYTSERMAIGYEACYAGLLAGTFPPSAVAIAAS